MLEEARRTWGDDPRVLERLGYYYYRLQDRPTARKLMEAALASGYESAELLVYLAIVLYYEGEYDAAVRRAEGALNLRGGYPLAEQIAGQSLLARVTRQAFALDQSLRLVLLQRALSHLQRSLLPDESTPQEESHNRRTQAAIAVAERQIAVLRGMSERISA